MKRKPMCIKKRIRWVIFYQSKGMNDEWIRRKLGYKHKNSIQRCRRHQFFHAEAERVKHKLDQPVGYRRKNYTQEEIDTVKELIEEGLTIPQMADRMGITFYRAENILYRRCGLKTKSIRRMTEAEKKEAIELYDSGLSVRKVADKLGFSHTAIGRLVVKKYGVRRRLVSESDKEEIYRLYDLGMNGVEIAEKIGFYRTTVTRILREAYGYRNSPPGWKAVTEAWETND